MKLIKYLESEMTEHVYFYVDINEMPVSPTFNSESEAEKWLAQWDSFKPNKDLA